MIKFLNYIFRTEVVKIYGNLDYSLLKYLSDKVFIWATLISAVVEGILHHVQIIN
jgi:hypothetical protein